jgi:hypothetical protein
MVRPDPGCFDPLRLQHPDLPLLDAFKDAILAFENR